MKAGWQTEKLGSVCAFLSRGISPSYLDEGGVCVLNQKCIRDHRISYEQSRRHDPAVKPVNPERHIQLGDVLVNSTGTGTLGRVAQVREEPPEITTVDSHVTIVRPKAGKFFLEFFGYMLILIEEEIKKAGEGCGGQTELARSVLAERFLVSYPTSIEEQHRIVAILDQAFDGITSAQAQAEQNLQNARALFQSAYAAIFDEAISDGYQRMTVADIAAPFKGSMRTGPFGSQLLHSEFVDDGIAVLGIDNAVCNEFRWDRRRYITEEKYKELSRYRVRPGDVIITIMGTCGRCAIVPDDIPVAINTKHLCCITLDAGKCLPTFLHGFFLYHPMAQEFLAARAKGSIMAGLNMSIISELPVLLPSLAQQERMSQKVASLREETQRLESLYQRKLAALDDLKKSLLHQAFSGAL